MYRILKLGLATAVLAGAMLVVPPASATSFSIQIGGGHHGYNHGYKQRYKQRYKPYKYGHRYRSNYRRHHYKRRYSKNHFNHGYRRNYSYSKHSYRRACHPVEKYGVDEYGNQARIGGKMCYDAYGSGYVVPGSRYVIESY